MSQSSPEPFAGRSLGSAQDSKNLDSRDAGLRDASDAIPGGFLHVLKGDEASRAEAIAESERHFRDLANTMPQIVWTAGPDGAVDYFNSRWYEYTGMTPEASLGDGWKAAFFPGDIDRFSAERNRGLGGGDIFEAEVRLRDRRGVHRWHLIRSAPIKDETGRVLRRSGTATDIDDRRKAEAALQESEGRFVRFMQHLPGVAWIKDVQGRYVYVNDAAEKAFGIPGLDFRGKTDEEVFPPETAALFRESDKKALEAGAGVQMIESQMHIDGEIHHTLVSKFPIPGPDGQVGLVGGMAIDVSERVRAEHAIRSSEGRFRHLADAMPQMVWVTRPDRSVEYVNHQWLDYTGQTEEVALGPNGWQSAMHPDDLDRIVEASILSHTTGNPFEAEYRVRNAFGAYRWHLGRAVSIYDEKGQLVRRFGAATDIDDRKRSEFAARFLAEASVTLSALVDETGTLEKVAQLAVPAFADWCSIDLVGSDDLLPRLAVAHMDPAKVKLAHDFHLRYPPDPDRPQGLFHVIRTGESRCVAEITDELLVASARDDAHLGFIRSLGLRSYLSVPLEGPGGTLGAITFVAAESGRRYGQDDLRLAEDLAARAGIAIENARLYAELREADRRKDEFLATLAHELRNPLAPIRNALHMMRRPGDGPIEAERAMAERQVVHLARLIEDLMDVARISRGKIDLQNEVVDLARVVGLAVESARPLIEERHHRLTVTLPGPPIPLHADPTRLEQVIWNLLNNAAKYTPPGGQISLVVELSGNEAVLRVRDLGIGMKPEMLPRIFEMFAQDRDHRQHAQGGLGIGLSLVRALVEMHGGSISAHSGGPGTGSEFIVKLPLAATTAEVETDRPDNRPVTNDGPIHHRILVVDDNVDAARSLARLLSRVYGHVVRVAHDGPEALVLAGEFQPEVILLDIGLPGMDGHEVARRIRKQPEFSTTLLVALTGWGQQSDVEKSRAAGFDHHLVKPADPDAILELLAKHGER